MSIRNQILSVVIDAQVRIRQHVHRGHCIEGHIVSISLIFSGSITLFHVRLQWVKTLI